MMLGARTAAWNGWNKPYDAEVEYLESTAVQWIDTQITGEGYVDYSIKFSVVANPKSLQFVLAAEEQPNCFAPKIFWCEPNNLYFQSNNLEIIKKYTLNSIVAVDYIDGIVYLNGALIGNFGRQKIGDMAFKLFASYVDSFRWCGYDRIYYFKEWYDSELARDMIPVRVGNVGYMYDRVSGQLFGNAGTGAFIVGPDVSARSRGGGHKLNAVFRFEHFSSFVLEMEAA